MWIFRAYSQRKAVIGSTRVARLASRRAAGKPEQPLLEKQAQQPAAKGEARRTKELTGGSDWTEGITPDSGRSAAHGVNYYRCFLPDLAGFAASRCTEPGA